MSFDRNDIYSAPVLQGEDNNNENNNTTIIKAFKSFILEFRLDSLFIYRDQLRNNLLVKNFFLKITLDHLIGYNEDLFKKLNEDPTDIIPLFEIATTEVASRIIQLINKSDTTTKIPNCQLILESTNNNANILLRQLTSENVSKIVRISGIIVSSSLLASRASKLTIMCRTCRHTMNINLNNFNTLSGNSVTSLPKSCQADHSTETTGTPIESCGADPYTIIHEKSTFIDQQFLKLQELPESVPVGEMPRTILMTCDRYLTNKLVPGTRVIITGIYAIYQSKSIGGYNSSNGGSSGGGSSAVAIRNPYIKVLGMETSNENPINSISHFSEEEEETFLQLSRRPDLYQLISKSIAPSIYGNEDIKKSIVCLLIGGSKKILPDNMRLRGDINVLLLGDPGTAKSQLLKFVEKVSPIAVYTSGKGSSAAGLTASVQRDPTTREFYLEGGAMVLADGGVVCIDEFDKMRDEDRVAIHEAMEQQTISIAKAGITTVLNSRTSVLAAANPIYGRYDEMKSPGENIDFQTTILSRFDMIFIVKDEHNEARDISIANHVMNIHTGKTGDTEANGDNNSRSEIPIETLKRYITYCRSKCAPRLSPQAAEKLSSHFVNIRKQLLINELESTERSTIPITIRQLEAIIRITESLAKLELSPVANERHVNEAIRLFQASTMDALSQDPLTNDMGGNNNGGNQLLKDVQQIESELKRRLPIGWSTAYQTLRREFVEKRGLSQIALDKALYILERQETIQMRHQRQNIYRSGV
ncbi:probable Minichromosome maintenance protein 5 [Saccharomycodes ludwigii]|uniref:DNA replication licensing factor MCM5 n=1 Tax=Saccharomycodes ludwigii TaxID=36035 RepID=A0A376B7U3_9ASCO|nr:hypothetical protein SCDLUD_000895 [Saccharomycodes ludwigii]KAH3903271.1 hypothetical protein SCDLUD_000895 [Saccharomycodes ludwigii]SSD60190.1 probable Minichromosome maintenance protein 5 [Saccharomycodes ludwigii]